MLDIGTSELALIGTSKTVQLLAKRAIDLLCATLLLILLLPALVIVAVLVALSSRGPIFFSQLRLGQNGRVFRMHKFRTMVHNSAPTMHQEYYRDLVHGTATAVDGTYKLVNDPRITRIGKILRRFSLDELPQLWDVICGHMALVGPRPPLAYEVELYGSREWLRLAVKPGLTGLWQVSGRSALSFEEMIDLDIQYIQHWSIWLDIWILLRTPVSVLTGTGV